MQESLVDERIYKVSRRCSLFTNPLILDLDRKVNLIRFACVCGGSWRISAHSLSHIPRAQHQPSRCPPWAVELPHRRLTPRRPFGRVRKLTKRAEDSRAELCASTQTSRISWGHGHSLTFDNLELQLLQAQRNLMLRESWKRFNSWTCCHLDLLLSPGRLQAWHSKAVPDSAFPRFCRYH